jgi:hypothetical protein
VAIRATISLVQLQASTSRISLEAQTQYENSNATEIWVDPDSKNIITNDELLLSEVLFRVITKDLTDTPTITDAYSSHYSKIKAPDLFNIADTFVKVVTYKRDIADAFTLDDASQIDKDYYGNKGNIFAFLDIIGLDHTKIEEDSYSVSDVVEVAIHFSRSFSNSTTMLSEYTSAITKVITGDSVTLEDALLVDKDYYGYKPDSISLTGVTDVLDNSFGKGVSNLFTFTEEHGLQLSKSLDGSVDVFSINDVVSIERFSGRLINGAAINVGTLN